MTDHLKPVPKVTVLQTVTSLDIPTERILQAALETYPPLQQAVIIGVDAEGVLFFSSTMASGPECLWWIEKAKKRLLEYGND